MVTVQERTERDAETLVREPQRKPGRPRRTGLVLWTVVGVVVAVAVAVRVWFLLRPAGEATLEPGVPPAVEITAQHDAVLAQAVRERVATQHDSGIDQAVLAQTAREPTTHDSGLDRAVQERISAQHDSGIERLLPDGR